MAEAHVAIILAAGASTRLGHPKQLLEINGVPLLRRATLAALATQPRLTLVALGAEIAGSRAALAGLPVTILEVKNWNFGMGATLAAAVSAIEDHGSALLVLGVDQPALDAAHLSQLLAAWRHAPTHAVASAYSGVLGTPAVFPASWRGPLCTLKGDLGARDLLRAAALDVIALAAPQLALDIDRPEDWK